MNMKMNIRKAFGGGVSPYWRLAYFSPRVRRNSQARWFRAEAAREGNRK